MNSDRPTSQVTPRGAQSSESELAIAIRRRDLDRRWLVRWIVVVTGAGALLAYVAGLVPSTFAETWTLATITGLVLIALTGPWAHGRSARRRTVVT